MQEERNQRFEVTEDKRVWRCALQELIEEKTKKERNQSRKKKYKER